MKKKIKKISPSKKGMILKSVDRN